MAKGIFMAGAAVLLRESCSLDAVEKCLEQFAVGGRNPASEHWELGGPSLTVGFRPEVNGLVLVDVVDQRWPDHMGDPEKETTLFGAWSMGHFGPFAFPGGLARAGEQSWAWHEGKDVPERHGAFLRIRSSYVLGAGDDAPVAPEDYEPKAELLFVTKMAHALLGLEEALAYFNPNGEVLMGREALEGALTYAEKSGFPPLDAWANIRLYGISDTWKLMDTVGMQQVGMPDIEACFEVDRYRPGEVDQMLRTVSLYLLERGQVIKDGDTVPGAGSVPWRAMTVEEPLAVPAREVLRLIPQDGTTPPDAVVAAIAKPVDPANLPS
jgi:Domain of unknown function (DUF4261)